MQRYVNCLRSCSQRSSDLLAEFHHSFCGHSQTLGITGTLILCSQPSAAHYGNCPSQPTAWVSEHAHQRLQDLWELGSHVTWRVPAVTSLSPHPLPSISVSMAVCGGHTTMCLNVEVSVLLFSFFSFAFLPFFSFSPLFFFFFFSFFFFSFSSFPLVFLPVLFVLLFLLVFFLSFFLSFFISFFLFSSFVLSVCLSACLSIFLSFFFVLYFSLFLPIRLSFCFLPSFLSFLLFFFVSLFRSFFIFFFLSFFLSLS